jgi:hypothetical protein
MTMVRGYNPSRLRDVGVTVVKALDRKVGPVQYQARWIDKEQRLCKLLVSHLGNTSMIVIILRVSIIILADVVSGANWREG